MHWMLTMAFTPIENLKGFAQSRPPAIIFGICLVLMATAMISLTSYIGNTNIINPDYEQDWNSFLGHVSDLEFCVRGNASGDIAWTGTQTAEPSLAGMESADEPISPVHFKNYSLPLLLTIRPTLEFVHIPHNVTHLQGQIHGYQLGLKDELYAEAINITFELPYEWNTTDCSTGKCKPVQIVTCVHFIAQAGMFPSNVREPERCQSTNETGVNYYSYMEGYREKTMAKHFVCKYKPKIKVEYKWDPSLTIYLTLRDKNLINQHLMHTSTFLFVMVVIALMYALLKGRPKGRIIEKIPVMA